MSITLPQISMIPFMLAACLVTAFTLMALAQWTIEKNHLMSIVAFVCAFACVIFAFTLDNGVKAVEKGFESDSSVSNLRVVSGDIPSCTKDFKTTTNVAIWEQNNKTKTGLMVGTKDGDNCSFSLYPMERTIK